MHLERFLIVKFGQIWQWFQRQAVYQSVSNVQLTGQMHLQPFCCLMSLWRLALPLLRLVQVGPSSLYISVWWSCDGPNKVPSKLYHSHYLLGSPGPCNNQQRHFSAVLVSRFHYHLPSSTLNVDDFHLNFDGPIDKICLLKGFSLALCRNFCDLSVFCSLTFSLVLFWLKYYLSLKYFHFSTGQPQFIHLFTYLKLFPNFRGGFPLLAFQFNYCWWDSSVSSFVFNSSESI